VRGILAGKSAHNNRDECTVAHAMIGVAVVADVLIPSVVFADVIMKRFGFSQQRPLV
jgi:hypothetical protein